MRTAVVVSAMIALCAASAHAQRPQAAVVPSTITVGDVFHAAVRVPLGDGLRIEAPDSIPLIDDLEQAGRSTVREDSADGMRRVTVSYPLAAWRPGSYQLPAVALRVVGFGADSIIRVAVPAFEVQSVLPADTTGIEPKPAKDVLGANRIWWPLILALLVAAAIATALIIWWRRRRRKDEPIEVAPAVPPREAALAQLDALRREGLVERGELRELYERMSETLRHYAVALDAGWGVDLTTAELAMRLRRDASAGDALELTRILGAADMVKFARATTTRESSKADLDAARSWVEHFEYPLPAESDDARAA